MGLILLDNIKRKRKSLQMCVFIYMYILFSRLPGILVTVLILMVQQETDVADKHDPNFQYGSAQAVVALLLLWFSLFSKYRAPKLLFYLKIM